jgi:(p)ppGpp synthase/HD superfamily hydrolase
MANSLHRKQRRKGTAIPYVAHLLGVASIALEIGADEDQAITALLHDAVEDLRAARGPVGHAFLMPFCPRSRHIGPCR